MARMYMNVDCKELLRKLEQMAYNVQDTQQILEECGQFMEGEFKSLAPIDTGKLQASIGYKIKSDNIVEVGVQLSKAQGRVEYYSWYQEFGTRKMAANPYIRPGWDMNYNTVKEMMIEKFMQLLLK